MRAGHSEEARCQQRTFQGAHVNVLCITVCHGQSMRAVHALITLYRRGTMGKMGGAHILPSISSRNGASSSANHSLGASTTRGWKASDALAALIPAMRTDNVRHGLPENAERQLLQNPGAP